MYRDSLKLSVFYIVFIQTSVAKTCEKKYMFDVTKPTI